MQAFSEVTSSYDFEKKCFQLIHHTYPACKETNALRSKESGSIWTVTSSSQVMYPLALHAQTSLTFVRDPALPKDPLLFHKLCYLGPVEPFFTLVRTISPSQLYARHMNPLQCEQMHLALPDQYDRGPLRVSISYALGTAEGAIWHGTWIDCFKWVCLFLWISLWSVGVYYVTLKGTLWKRKQDGRCQSAQIMELQPLILKLE